MIDLNDYIPIVGKYVIDELYFLGERLKGKKVNNINSTAVGGGGPRYCQRWCRY